MPPPLSDRIAALKAKQDQLAARLKPLEAKAKLEDRKRDTRRKIIVGGTVLAAMERDQAFAAGVAALLARWVERPNDRQVIADLLPAGAGNSPALPGAASDGAAPAGSVAAGTTINGGGAA
jgi:hypothetical protein